MTAARHHADDTRADATTDAQDHLAELTRNHTHSQPVTRRYGQTTVTTRHQVRVPSLLRQLEWVAPTGRGDDRSGGGYESRPAAALDAMATAQDIDTAAARWLRILRHSDRGETEQLLTRLGTVLVDHSRLPACCRSRVRRDPGTGAPCCAHHQLAADIRRWWTRARVATGWDTPAWRPDNTCPACGGRGGLRVKEADKLGFCADCGETWPPETIGLLAEHIRSENAAEKRREVVSAACWCVYPHPGFERWPALCPACGSRYCHRASVAAARTA